MIFILQKIPNPMKAAVISRSLLIPIRDITFDKIRFLKTVGLFSELTVLWTLICLATDEFISTNNGLVSGVGLMTLFATSIFFGQQIKTFASFASLVLSTISTYLFWTFILGPLVGLTTDSLLLYSFANSLFVAVVMTEFLNKIIGIEFRVPTIILTFLFLLFAYYIMHSYSAGLNRTLNFQPSLAVFNLFQFLLIIPLSLGMTVKRTSQTNP